MTDTRGTLGVQRILDLLAERKALRAEVEKLMDGMDCAWGVIANVSGGNWEKQNTEWQTAAAHWRDKYWHPALERNIEVRGGDDVTDLDTTPVKHQPAPHEVEAVTP